MTMTHPAPPGAGHDAVVSETARPLALAPNGLSLGPLVYARGYDARTARHRLSVLVAKPEVAEAPQLRLDSKTVSATEVDRLAGEIYWRFDLALASGRHLYAIDGAASELSLAAPDSDLTVAFVSCNGKEEGDFERPESEREVMWTRLLARHEDEALSLMIMGGDQIYADAALSAHPDVEAWADAAPDRRADFEAGPEAEDAVTAVFLDRWRRSVRTKAAARLMAEVPTVAMWDDHDIFDGYGSHPEPVQTSPIGRMLFRVARRFFRLFQAGGHDPACPQTLSTTLPQPGFSVLAPDLRSERQPKRVLGEAGWAALNQGYAEARTGEPLFVLSTVPALGPRLSLVERLHRLVPGAQRYEDDLRDQWQSYAHRAEWRRFLTLAAEHADEVGPVTFLSGEIHLAGRGEMRTPKGSVLHQLIASGVSHPPPPQAFARALGALGALGEAPLKAHPIRIRTLPGQARRYCAERNVLLLERRDGDWTARWDLEQSGLTPALKIASGPRPALSVVGKMASP